jgi:GntR family transcriptional regulator
VSDYTPHYRRIITDIRAKIDSGEWAPGDQIPTTPQLAEQYRVGKSTIRTAIQMLIELGLLRGMQGIGVFVADRTA